MKIDELPVLVLDDGHDGPVVFMSKDVESSLWPQTLKLNETIRSTRYGKHYLLLM